jgi:hypothetical protein
MLGLILLGVSTFSFVAGLLEETISLLAILGIVAGLLIGLLSLKFSITSINKFQSYIANEEQLLSKHSDSERITKALSNIERDSKLIIDMKCIISTLVGKAANAIESGNLKLAIEHACGVITECVAHSPKELTQKVTEVAESGMNKFLGLFHHLGVDPTGYGLKLVYVAFTGYPETPLDTGTVIDYLGIVSQVSYEVGIISPDVKDKIDYMLNNRSLYLTANLEDVTKKAPDDVTDIAREMREEVTPAPAMETKTVEDESTVVEEVKEGSEPVEEKSTDDVEEELPDISGTHDEDREGPSGISKEIEAEKVPDIKDKELVDISPPKGHEEIPDEPVKQQEAEPVTSKIMQKEPVASGVTENKGETDSEDDEPTTGPEAVRRAKKSGLRSVIDVSDAVDFTSKEGETAET